MLIAQRPQVGLRALELGMKFLQRSLARGEFGFQFRQRRAGRGELLLALGQFLLALFKLAGALRAGLVARVHHAVARREIGLAA
ncbi:MAG: hypothetical protein SFY95_12620 [Planctomycetota bacterium]|nr:hypothetical protein [Planctomycetota bacterium]